MSKFSEYCPYEQAEILEKRLWEATDFLGFPSAQDVLSGKPKVLGMNNREVISTFLGFKEIDWLFYTALHFARVALNLVEIGTYLNLNKQALQILFYSGEVHDVGKINLNIEETVRKSDRLIKNKTNGKFSKEDIQRMHHHVVSSAYLQDYPFIGKIVLLHHFHQKKSYPTKEETAGNSFIQKLMNNLTPKIIFYSQLLALADYKEASSTRADDGKIRPAGIVKKLILEEYNDMRIKYFSPTFSIDTSGSKLINDLYSNGIFEKCDPFVPYLTKNSFIYNAGKI